MSATTLVIRPAREADLPAVAAAYAEHFAYERTHKAWTIFQEGVYPTEEVARKALARGWLHVALHGEELAGSMICNTCEPPEYASIAWPVLSRKKDAKAFVLHLLMVRPSFAGQGIGAAMVRHTWELAREQGLDVLRLDTGAQNEPARHLYAKLGFDIISTGGMAVGGILANKSHLFLEKALF